MNVGDTFKGVGSGLTIWWRRRAFGAQKREQVWRLVGDLVAADIALNVALRTAATASQESGQSSVAAILLDMEAGIARMDVHARVSQYATGPEALLFYSIGKTDAKGIFRAASRLAKQQYKIRSAITSALAMPAILSVLLMVIFYVMGTQLFPAIDSIGTTSDGPWYVQLISAFAQWFAKNVIWVLIPLGLIGAFIAFALPNWSGKGRNAADKIPPFSLYKLAQGTGFIFTVIELARMGQTLQPSLLNELAKGTSPYLHSRITAIAKLLGSKKWGEAMQQTGNQFPARDLITVSAALDGTDNWVERFAEFLDRWLEQLDERIKAQVKVLNGVMLFLITAILGAVASSMMSILSTIG